MHGCTGKGNDQLRFELAFKANYPGRAGDRAAARPRLDARRGDRVRARARHPGHGHRRLAVLDRREPVRPLDRGRASSRTPGRRRPRSLPAHRRTRTHAPAPIEIVIGFEAGLPVSLDGEELPLHELIAALNAAGRRVRDRPDRHDREPRRRHQEPRAVRGAGGDDADRRAPRARGPRPDEGRARDEAPARGSLGPHRLRRPLVHPVREALDAFVDEDAGARHRRGSGRAAAGGGGRQRPPLASTRSTRRRSRRTRPGRRSRTRRPRASSGSPRSRPSWPPPAAGKVAVG